MRVAAITDLDIFGVGLMVAVFAYALLLGTLIPPIPELVIPFSTRKLTIRSPFRPTDCVRRLSARFDGTGVYGVRGHVGATTFMMRRATGGLDSFRSFAAGSINPLEDGSVLRIRMGLSGIVLLGAWLFFFIGIGLSFFARAPEPNVPFFPPPDRYVPALAISLACAVLLSWSLSRIWNRADMDELEYVLRNSLESS